MSCRCECCTWDDLNITHFIAFSSLRNDGLVLVWVQSCVQGQTLASVVRGKVVDQHGFSN